MGRIGRLRPDQVGADVKTLFETFLEERGNIPNMFRTVAHRPEILTTMLAHFRAVMGPGMVPVSFKEMLAVRVSRLNDCDY
jgi:alkylhydroperoxidase family enzyme